MSTTPERPLPPRVQRRGARHPGAGLAGHRHRQGHERLVPADRDGGARGRLPALHHGPRDGLGRPRHRRGTRRAASSTRRTGPPSWARSPDALSPLTSEFLVEAQSGGTCVVRVTSSGFGTGADWESEFWDDMGPGWMPFFDNLRLYLVALPRPGGHAASRSPPPTPATRTRSGRALRDALGLGDEGAAVDVRGATGTVERVGERQTLVRLTAPVPGMLSVYAYGEGDGKATAGVRAYLFSPDAADYARREEPAWQAWLQWLSVPCPMRWPTASGSVGASGSEAGRAPRPAARGRRTRAGRDRRAPGARHRSRRGPPRGPRRPARRRHALRRADPAARPSAPRPGLTQRQGQAQVQRSTMATSPPWPGCSSYPDIGKSCRSLPARWSAQWAGRHRRNPHAAASTWRRGYRVGAGRVRRAGPESPAIRRRQAPTVARRRVRRRTRGPDAADGRPPSGSSRSRCGCLRPRLRGCPRRSHPG